MNSAASIDNLIFSLQKFKEASPNSQGKLSKHEFDNIFSEEVTRLENVNKSQKSSDFQTHSDIMHSIKIVDKSYAPSQIENWLLDTQSEAISNRPSVRDFMNVTGTNVRDASEFLYGVIGSNADLRDWSKIMGATSPIDAVRKATSQLYNSDKQYELYNDDVFGTNDYSTTLAQHSLSSHDIKDQQGNFADVQASQGSVEKMAVTSSGLILRGAGVTQAQIERTAWLFGFSTEGLFPSTL